MPKLPAVSAKKFCKFLEVCGCRFDGIEGDHYVYRKEGLMRPIVVPAWKELPMFIVLGNLRTLGVSRDEFIRRLKKI